MTEAGPTAEPTSAELDRWADDGGPPVRVDAGADLEGLVHVVRAVASGVLFALLPAPHPLRPQLLDQLRVDLGVPVWAIHALGSFLPGFARIVLGAIAERQPYAKALRDPRR